MLSIRTAGVTQAAYRLDVVARRLGDMRPQLEAATLAVYEHTRQRFESAGDGEWPPLAESTVARKESQGYAEPQRELFATGNLFESATSPQGPYSNRLVTEHQAVIQVLGVGEDGGGDPELVPVYLSEGTDRMPARPIWPAADDPRLVDDVAAALKHGIL